MDMYEIQAVVPVKSKEELTRYQGTQSVKNQLGEVGSVEMNFHLLACHSSSTS